MAVDQKRQPGRFSYAKQFNAKGISPALLRALQDTAIRNGYNVEVFSGFRPGDKRLHGKQLAVDVRMLDANGKALPNYQDPKYFPQYQRYAHQVYDSIAKSNPEMAARLRWGGYFSGPKGKYGALDLMHFDLGWNRIGMGGGSWANGLTQQQAKIWGLTPGLPQGVVPVAPVAVAANAAPKAAAATVNDIVAQTAAQAASSQAVASQLAQSKPFTPMTNPFGSIMQLMSMAAASKPKTATVNEDPLPGIGGIGGGVPPQMVSASGDGAENLFRQTKHVDNRRKRMMV